MKNTDAAVTTQDSTVNEALPVIALDSTITDPLVTKEAKLLITNHFNTYFIYKGVEKGLEFELLEMYLKDRNIKLQIEVSHELKGMRDSLLVKKAHFGSASFMIPLDSLGAYRLSDYLYKTDVVVVRRKESPSLEKSIEPIYAHLIDDGPFMESVLRNHLSNPKIRIVPAELGSTKQSLIGDVASGKIDYTFCSKNEASIMQIFHPNLDVSEVLLPDLPITLMVHPKCDSLRADFNEWLTKNRNTSDFQWTIKKYSTFSSQLKRDMAQTTPTVFASKISNFDKLIQENALQISWDWRLLSALIYQESRFDPTVKSWVGAMGLMQVMPTTALAHAKVKASDLLKPTSNLLAGTSFIKWMQNNYFNEPEIAETDRAKFILASYNAGVGHVADARALAKKNGLNPNVWDGNVEKMILAKSNPKYYKDPVCKYGYCRGQETAQYVSNIIIYYEHYSKFVQD